MIGSRWTCQRYARLDNGISRKRGRPDTGIKTREGESVRYLMESGEWEEHTNESGTRRKRNKS